MGAGRGVALALCLAACTTEEWRAADLQLDISGAQWDSEQRARLCVDGVGILEEAMAAGRIGYTGVPDDIEVVLTVDLLDDTDTGSAGSRLGRAGPVSFASGSWQSVVWEDCTGDCPACTSEAAGSRADDDDLLLAVRFQ